MKALTPNGEWYPFTLKDLPTRFNNNEFALMNCPNSPRLSLQNIRRGDASTGLYEGDIIEWMDTRWMVCYERGFYVICESYETHPLSELSDFTVVGDCFKDTFGVPFLKRDKCLFKYNDVIFRLEDIIGPFNGDRVILRSVKKPILVEDIQQEAGMSIDGKRVYFGDKVDDGVVDLYKGRIVLLKSGTYIDIFTGGVL